MKKTGPFLRRGLYSPLSLMHLGSAAPWARIIASGQVEAVALIEVRKTPARTLAFPHDVGIDVRADQRAPGS